MADRTPEELRKAVYDYAREHGSIEVSLNEHEFALFWMQQALKGLCLYSPTASGAVPAMVGPRGVVRVRVKLDAPPLPSKA